MVIEVCRESGEVTKEERNTCFSERRGRREGGGEGGREGGIEGSIWQGREGVGREGGESLLRCLDFKG